MLQKLILVTSLLRGASALALRRQSACSFHLRTDGALAAPVGQFDSGQARAGPGETPANFTVTGDTVTDAQGRGCWWTPPALVLQCDAAQGPEAGFAIACDGAVSFKGQSTFYACDTGADGLAMISLEPHGSPCGEVRLYADGCFPGGCGASPTVSSGTSTSTNTLPLGGLTSYLDLVSMGSTGNAGAPTSAPSPGSASGATLPLGGLTSYRDLISSLGGNTPFSAPGTAPSGSTATAAALPLGGLTSYEALISSIPTGASSPGSGPSGTTTAAALPLDGLTSYAALISSIPTGASSPAGSTGGVPSGTTTAAALPLGGLTSYAALISSIPTGSPASGTGSPPASSGTPGSSCPGDLSPGAYEFPHLIIPLDSANPSAVAGTSYFGAVNATVSTAFTFDIPSSAAGKTCTAVFYLPTQSQLETSSYNLTGSGAVRFARLDGAVSEGTSYANLPAVAEAYNETTLVPGNAYTVAALACPAGGSVTFEMSGAGGGGNATDFRYFQDYNPCPIGLYVIVS